MPFDLLVIEYAEQNQAKLLQGPEVKVTFWMPFSFTAAFKVFGVVSAMTGDRSQNLLSNEQYITYNGVNAQTCKHVNT